MNRTLSVVASATLLMLASCSNPISTGPLYKDIDGKMIDSSLVKTAMASPPKTWTHLQGYQIENQHTLSLAKMTGDQAEYLMSSCNVASPELNNYLRGIVTRLLAGWHGPQPDVSVFIRTGDGLNAEAVANQDLFFNVGSFRRVGSEDEIAFILAHELGHVLLGHAERPESVARTRALTGLASRAAAVGATLAVSQVTHSGNDFTLSRMPGEDPSRNIIVATVAGSAVDKLMTDVIEPGWTRHQEQEADLLGTDLLIQAGYNPDAGPIVMKALDQQEQIDKAALAKDEASYQAAMTAALSQGNLAGAMQATVKGSLDVLSQGVKASGVTDTHPASADRATWLEGYHDKAYDDLENRPFKRHPLTTFLAMPQVKRVLDAHEAASAATGELVNGNLAGAERQGRRAMALAPHEAAPLVAMAAVERASGHQAAAIQRLQQAIKTDNAPIIAYIDLSAMLAIAGNRHDALAVLDAGVEKFGTEQPFRPQRIAIHRRFKDQKEADAEGTRCEKEDDLETRQECRVAMGNRENATDWHDLMK
jgi:predicted Zn-dependent protease